MIDCPVCHVMNEDMARFCAECGQRLSGPMPAPTASQPMQGVSQEIPCKPVGMPPEGSRAQVGRLKSPLLGSEDFEAEPQSQARDLSRLRGVPTRKATGEGSAAGQSAGKGLRSPLLGADPQLPGEPAEPHKGRRGLHSPLLEGSESSESSGEPPRDSSRSGLRSPLLGAAAMEDEVPYQQLPSGGLRSPLLGKAGGEYDESATGDVGARSRPLRSPLLGGAESLDYGLESTYPEIVEEENPNVLRSPLLAAKIPLPERTPAKPAIQPEEQIVLAEPPVPSPASYPVGQAVPPSRIPIESPIPNQPTPLSPRTNLSSFQPAGMPGTPSQAAGPVAAPQQSSGVSGGTTQDYLGPTASSPIEESQELPSALQLKAGARKSPQAPLAPRRLRHLGTSAEEPLASPPFAPESPGGSSMVKLLIWPLLLAGALKIWSLLEFHNKNQLLTPYLVDQIGQLIVIVCLVVLMASVGRKA